MSTTEINNPRFAHLRRISGLGTSGEFEVRSNSTLFGHYDIIGRTDDVAQACRAAVMLNERFAVPCEKFTANEAVG